MNVQTAERPTAKHALGALVNEGKTKKIHLIASGSDRVTVVAKDDITAGDGAKHDIIPDKGRLATTTTSNVFRLLKACGLPVAFIEQDSAISFFAPKCEMLPYEVVVRREAHGSYLKRNPHVAKGHLFPRLIVEFFLKTKDTQLEGKAARLRRPDDAVRGRRQADRAVQSGKAGPRTGAVSRSDPAEEVFGHEDEWKMFPEMRRIVRQAFLVLEKAWQLEGGTLVDLKVEFGLDAESRLLLADVIDNDSWRVIEGGSYIDKQVYRDGGALDDVAAKYRHVAEITGHFHVPPPAHRSVARLGPARDRHLQGRARRACRPDDGGHLLASTRSRWPRPASSIA